MTNFKHINRSGLSLLLFISIAISLTFFQTGCEPEEECFAPRVDSLTFRDSLSAIDYLVPGTVVTLHGDNLDKTSSVIVNKTSLDASYMLIYEKTLTFMVPYIDTNDPEQDLSDSIRVIKECGESLIMVDILNPPPYIKTISNEYAIPGDTLELTGLYFSLLEGVIFPDQLEGEILSEYTDSTCSVVVPEGNLTEGDINLISKSGDSRSSYNIAYRDRSGLICNFDDVNTKQDDGGSVLTSGSMQSVPANNGDFFLAETANIAPGTIDIHDTRLALGVMNEWEYTGNLTPDFFNIKLEAFLKYPWTSGVYKIEIGKQVAGNVEYAYTYDYKPWESDTVVDWSSSWTRWKTISIPLSDFKLIGSEDIYLQSFSQVRAINYMVWTFENPAEEENGGGVSIDNFGLAMDNVRIKQVKEEE